MGYIRMSFYGGHLQTHQMSYHDMPFLLLSTIMHTHTFQSMNQTLPLKICWGFKYRSGSVFIIWSQIIGWEHRDHLTHNFSITIEISFCSHPNFYTVITTKFCTCKDSIFFMADANICGDLMGSNHIPAIWILHWIRIMSKILLVKWARGWKPDPLRF